jgi:aminoglycoside/choline kinase family phosphotransferase
MSDPSFSPAPRAGAGPVVAWSDPQRERAFQQWLTGIAGPHQLDPASVRPASADASFRRYLRVDGTQGSRIIMDAPPDKEDCRPFVKVAAADGRRRPARAACAGLGRAAGLHAAGRPRPQTMIEVIDPQQPAANLPLYLRAVDALITWQLASRPGVLPAYDEALLRANWRCFPTGTWRSTAASCRRRRCARRSMRSSA